MQIATLADPGLDGPLGATLTPLAYEAALVLFAMAQNVKANATAAGNTWDKMPDGMNDPSFRSTMGALYRTVATAIGAGAFANNRIDLLPPDGAAVFAIDLVGLYDRKNQRNTGVAGTGKPLVARYLETSTPAPAISGSSKGWYLAIGVTLGVALASAGAAYALSRGFR